MGTPDVARIPSGVGHDAFDDDDALKSLSESERKETPDNPLDVLRVTLQEEPGQKTIKLPVPSRNNIVVEFDTSIEAAEMNAWRKRAKDKRFPLEVDPVMMACIVIANKCVGIYVGDKQVESETETPLTFRSPDMHQLTGNKTGRVVDAVKLFYGGKGFDAHLIATSNAVIRAAGYDDELEPDEEDSPTQDS